MSAQSITVQRLASGTGAHRGSGMAPTTGFLGAERVLQILRSVRGRTMRPHPVLSFSLPDVLCSPNDLIWMKRTPFEAMTGRTAPSSDILLAEVFWDFPQL